MNRECFSETFNINPETDDAQSVGLWLNQITCTMSEAPRRILVLTVTNLGNGYVLVAAQVETVPVDPYTFEKGKRT